MPQKVTIDQEVASFMTGPVAPDVSAEERAIAREAVKVIVIYARMIGVPAEDLLRQCGPLSRMELAAKLTEFADNLLVLAQPTGSVQ